MEKESKKNPVLSVLKTIIFLLIIFLIIIAFHTSFSKEPGKSFFGLKIYSIVTGSMEPKYKIGDVILVKEVDFDDIKVGDVIAYLGMENDLKDKVITHQVESILHEGDKNIFYTKGIASNIMDPPVYEEQVYGKVVCKFFILSIIRKMINNVWGFFFVVLLPLVILFVFEFKEVKILFKIKKRAENIKKIRESKQQKKN